MMKYDNHFVLFLLNGLSDEQAEISSKCKEMLEEHGKNMKDALIQLGEEQSDFDEKMSIDGGSS